MIIDLVIFLLGVGVLFVSGDLLVRSSIDFSLKLGVSPLVIGLTIIAFGTSAPELLVAIKASLDGFNGLAIGNIIGSNIANVLLVLGAPALIMNINNTDLAVGRNYYFMLLATTIFVIFLLTGGISFVSGVCLIVGLVMFMGSAFLFRTSLDKGAQKFSFQERETIGLSGTKLTIFTIIGFCGLPLGAEILIISATDFAQAIGMSEEVVGLTLVAVGTSLPEFATSIMAAIRREVKLLLGNVIGSNMFNILGIAGVAALISPLSMEEGLYLKSVSVLIICTLILIPFIFWNRSINRVVGIGFLFLYIGYIMILT